MAEQEMKLINFKASREQMAVINAIRREHYLMNQSEVVRMLIDAGAEKLLGKAEAERIRKECL